jgi:hypothetical protein
LINAHQHESHPPSPKLEAIGATPERRWIEQHDHHRFPADTLSLSIAPLLSKRATMVFPAEPGATERE